MKKNLLTMTASAAVATLLLSAFSACTKDVTPALPVAGSCHVTVSAGIPATKSTAVQNGNTYSLRFTVGDRLFIHGTQEDVVEGGTLHLAGYLDMDSGSISEDGKQATFSGTLNYYKEVTVDGKVWYQATDRIIPPNPLQACETTVVRLIPQAVGEYLHEATVLNNSLTDLDVYVEDCMVESLDVLMSSAVDVSGSYDAARDRIVLNHSDDVVLDVELTGLVPYSSYTLILYLAEDPDHDAIDESEEIIEGQVTADSEGKVAFVISAGIGGRSGKLFFYSYMDGYITVEIIALFERDPFDPDTIYQVSRSSCLSYP